MKTYEAAGYITKFNFTTTLLVNSFLIYLTVFHIKQINKTYKWMIVIFATMGITFSFLEVTVRPCFHNFNGGFIYFSLNPSLPVRSGSLLTARYSGFFCSILVYVAVQFIYRCWSLTDNPLISLFQGFKVIVWVLFVLTPSAMFAGAVIFLMSPDEFSDGYMKNEMLKVYELGMSDFPRFIVIAYDYNDKIRWKDVLSVGTLSGILFMNLTIIGFTAYRMKKEMKARLKEMSKRNRRLETQFFKALLAQSAFPTFLLIGPVGPVLLLPFFNFKISLQAGFLYSLISLYPPLDSIAMMLIITEYKSCARKLAKRLRSYKKKKSVDSVTSLNVISS